jgi:glycerol-3-phosphate dehydrogenase
LRLFDPIDELAALAEQGWSRRLHPNHPYTEADVMNAVRREDAVHAIDVLARRLTLALVDRQAAREAAPRVIELMAGELGWDEAAKAAELALVEKRLSEAL